MPSLRAAAVVLAIFAGPPHGIVFIERAAHLRAHAGQIGFPGGSVDEADGADRARTALRELHEEVGVPPERIALVGRLPDVEQRVTGFVVTPFVGVIEPDTPLILDPAETAAVFTVPLERVVAPGAVHEGIEVVGERAIETWVFDDGDLHVWGLTGRMLRSFVEAWRADRSALRAAIAERLRPG